MTPEKGVFYCFGCHKGGGLFQFVMEAEKVPCRDAVELLAKKAGVELPREEEEQGGIRRETFLELNRQGGGELPLAAAREPAGARPRGATSAERRVSEETLEAFQLGWAPPDRRWLLAVPDRQELFAGFPGAHGAVHASRAAARSGRPCSPTRIMFPIANARGEVLAFGGRAMGDAQPKYLNSPETAFFRKGENLFGIEKAGPAIREAGCFHLVEGYVDVLAMHQAGVDEHGGAPGHRAHRAAGARAEAVGRRRPSWCSTATRRATKATLRAIELCERQEVSASVVGAARRGGTPRISCRRARRRPCGACWRGKRPAFAFLLAEAAARFGTSGAEAKEQARDFLFPFVAAATSRLRAEEYLRQAADALGASTEAVAADFARWQDRQRGRMPVRDRPPPRTRR